LSRTTTALARADCKGGVCIGLADNYQFIVWQVVPDRMSKRYALSACYVCGIDAAMVELVKVYDFRNPPSGDPGFKWSSVSEDYMEWTPAEYRDMLQHPKAERQFHNDIEAMLACDMRVLVLPCGRSAHTEAGWFAGKGRTTIAYIPEKQEPELMYKLFSGVCCSIDELIEALK